jgi:transposase-like protein
MQNEQAFPETLQQAIIYFSDLERCHNFMVDMRWPFGVACPRCGSKEVGKFSKPRFVCNCKGCKKQFTVKVGTIFEDSPLPLTKWLPAVWMIVNVKNGKSSCEMARDLGVTKKTAWFMEHRIRTALVAGVSRR